MRPAAAEAFLAATTELGNPSSLHSAGRDARRGLEEAREQVAEALGAQPAEVVFTAGGTEADNLAITGMMRGRWRSEPQRRRLVVSAVEHPAVLEAAAALGRSTVSQTSDPGGHELGGTAGDDLGGTAMPQEDVSPAALGQGGPVVIGENGHRTEEPSAPSAGVPSAADVRHLAVDATGVVDLDHLEELLADGHTGLVSVMWANNETGAVQPVPDVVRLARSHGAWVHSDAVQAVGHLPVSFADSGLDALTVSGHKIGAPIGIGALVVRRDVTLEAVEHGGGQERGVRSGTLPAPGARALATALTVAVAERQAEARRLERLRDELIHGVLSSVAGARLSGPTGAWPKGPGGARPGPAGLPGGVPAPTASSSAQRLPNIAHFTIEGCDADALLFGLDMAGVCASSGSACQAGVQEASHVLLAMGHDEAAARSAVRFSLGWTSTRDDVAAVLEALPEVVERARAANRPRTARSG